MNGEEPHTAMSSSPLYLLCLTVLLLNFQPAIFQTVVENKYCDAASLNCGAPEKPSSEKYCCADGPSLFRCCNPYIGLNIGLSVGVPLSIGVPLILVIIVGVVVLCCCCARYHNKKMMALAVAYRDRESEQENGEESTHLAPPTDEATGDGPELLSYSATEPYGQPPTYPEQTEASQTTETIELQSTIVGPEDEPLLS